MVKLVICNGDGDSELEKALIEKNIQFQLVFDLNTYGLEPPHLIVDGVPLDAKRSLKWVESYSNDGI